MVAISPNTLASRQNLFLAHYSTFQEFVTSLNKSIQVGSGFAMEDNSCSSPIELVK